MASDEFSQQEQTKSKMSNNISISIDVTLLDKARFKEMTRKNGKLAKFADLVLIATPDGQFGDFMVKQSVTKEEREAKVEMPILGNGRYLVAKSKPAAKPAAAENNDAPVDDIPF
jgi:hypothetical protein